MNMGEHQRQVADRKVQAIHGHLASNRLAGFDYDPLTHYPSNMTSPGEPGVTYIMGGGFVRPFPADSAQATGEVCLRERAQERNRGLIERIKARRPEIAIDLERDVAPLTPASAPTEHHIVIAYIRRAEAVWPDPTRRCAFWAGVLRNDGAIANLDDDMIMEVPAIVDAAGPRAVSLGCLPETVAPICALHGRISNIVADATVLGSRDLALQALLLDIFVPNLATARAILYDMLEYNAAYGTRFQTCGVHD